MPSEPISIIHTPPNTSHPTLGTLPNQTVTSPSSSVSISPQTPFLPPPGSGLSPSTATPTAITSSGFFKWAASTLANSPGAMSPPQKGFDIPVVVNQDNDKDHDHESHDSFEFGDFQDLKSRSWTTSGRRAVSMSVPSGQGVSGITSMLKGFGETQNAPSQGGVMADKVARGQGVLRRLSLSGTNYRPTFLSPPSANVPLPTSPSINSATVPNPMSMSESTTTPASVPASASMPRANDMGPPKADIPVQRAATLGSGRRRYSDNGTRRRGVSPMGERILREQGHF